jgi:hypothetical protein
MNTTTLNTMIINNVTDTLLCEVRASVGDTVTQVVREEVRNAMEREAVPEAVAARVASMDIDVYSSLNAVLHESVAQQISTVREVIMQSIMAERVRNVSPADLAYYIINSGGALTDQIVEKCMEQSETMVAVATDRAVERCIDSLLGSATSRRRIEELIAAKMAETLLARMEATATASMVPDGTAEPIRDDAEALANAIMNGGPF